jgi:hypothetical protein
MSKVLDQLPYADSPTVAVVKGEPVPVLAHQIIVWVSISIRDLPSLSGEVARIPAILDTGNTFGFSITEEELFRWCGLEPQALEVLGRVFINRRELARYAADVWIHRNQRGHRDKFRQAPPYRLELRDGIAVFPSGFGNVAPRLPLLGLRAIDENGLRCTINGSKRTVSLSVPEPS